MLYYYQTNLIDGRHNFKVAMQLLLCLALPFRHLLDGGVLQFPRLVVVGRHLQQPLVLDLDGVPHVLLRGEDELVVDDPARQVLEQGRVRVDHHLLVVLHSLIVPTLHTQLLKKTRGGGVS